MTTIGKSAADRVLSNHEVRQIVSQAAATLNLAGKRVLTIIPDGTRTMPMPLMFQLLQEEIGARAAACDYLVALGTHPHMSEAQLTRLMGRPVVNGLCGTARVSNHRWDLPGTFVDLGSIPADQVAEASGGLLSEAILVKINRLLFDYDQVLICGPVFPHEVVGFSGGNKYLFPGVSTGEMINQTHWLGALLGSYNLIGTACTPVRALIDRAAGKVTVPVACFALVLRKQEIAGIYFGSAMDAWKEAAALSAQEHIQWEDRPFRRVLSVLPRMYDDIWTGAKGMYKLEPAIADGGDVVLFAPHITEFSYTHGAFLDRIGYHCRDYFLKQWHRFDHVPRGVIAHATHLIGQGSYDPASGVENLRIKVTLATGIPEERCRRLNLNYIDPEAIRLEDWRGREDEGIKLVPHAGEILYRLKAQKPEPAHRGELID
ncbi:MAG: lactate racemase domain-containing protein [Terriglobales bacterium]